MILFGQSYHCRERLIVAIVLLIGIYSNITIGQNQTSSAKIYRIRRHAEHLRMSVNETLAMEFKVPIKRAAIANDKIATVSVISPKLVIITGKAFGFTQLLIWDEKGTQTLYDIRVDVNLARLTEIIKEAAPRAKIKLTSMLDTVVLSGTVPDAPTAKRVINLAKVFVANVQNQLSVAGAQQVMLRTTVAEVSRRVIKALGLNGTFFGAKAFGGTNLNMLNPTSIGLQERTLVPIGNPNQFQIIGGDLTVQPTTTLYFGLPRAQMELFMQAMQENGLIRVLAKPNLVAISGHKAEFLAGGELPIPTPNENGIAITFREYGVRLDFQPIVQAGEMIRLIVTSEVSEPDFTNAVQISGLTVPGLNKRQAQTVVELGAGQTFAIAGLLSESVRGIVNKVPGIGELPVLGALFRSVRFEKAQSELVVLVTPDIVSPLNPNQVNYIPGRDIQEPDDWELYGLGLLESRTPTTSPSTQPAQPRFIPPGPLAGPWGPDIR